MEKVTFTTRKSYFHDPQKLLLQLNKPQNYYAKAQHDTDSVAGGAAGLLRDLPAGGYHTESEQTQREQGDALLSRDYGSPQRTRYQCPCEREGQPPSVAPPMRHKVASVDALPKAHHPCEQHCVHPVPRPIRTIPTTDFQIPQIIWQTNSKGTKERCNRLTPP